MLLLESVPRSRRLTPARAVRLITLWTLIVTVVSGAAMHLIDPAEFPTIGRGLWWAAQTVTSVGYGDTVPHETIGRLLAFVVMVNAIALVTVVAGAVTAAMIEAVREREAPLDLPPTRSDLAEMTARLRAIEEVLRDLT